MSGKQLAPDHVTVVSMISLPRRASARHARRLALPFLIAAPFAIAAAPAQAGTVSLETAGCGGAGGVTANDWTVPAGVTSVSIFARGASGGLARGLSRGGQAAYVQGRLSVTPGEVLHVCVDVGGGRGGASPDGDGADGGGYTSLHRRTDLVESLLIAGGGGGAGGGVGGISEPAGGIAIPVNGVASGDGAGWSYSLGGRGALTGAGAGGENTADAGFSGFAGRVREGGAGGRGGYGAPGGGGGGGGVWGGGGGAGGNGVWDGDGAGGGGGGGSSYCDLQGCSSGPSGGRAVMTFSWTDPVTTTTTVTTDPASPLRGEAIVYKATIAPVPSGGHVAFTVDGYDLPHCSAQTVDTTTGEATCNAMAPWRPGSSRIEARYTGAGAFTSSNGSTDITVRGSALTLTPGAVVFGDVVVGKVADQTVTVTSTGDADLVIGEDAFELFAPDGPDFAPRGGTRAAPPRAVGYAVVDDQCAERVLAPGQTCTVTIRFSPERLGAHPAELWVGSNSWHHAQADVSGVGVVAPPEPEPRPQPQPEPRPQPQPQPEPRPQPQPEPKPKPEPAARGAFAAPGATARGSQVSRTGDLRLPLVCPVGQPCRVSGQLTLTVAGGSAARISASTTRVLVRFSGVRIAAGRTRALSLRLPTSFVKAQQKKGVRKLRTTLTVRTTLGSGRVITERQQLTLLIPRARAAQRRAPARRPSFTG